jgi:uncharacterized protein (TIGR02145 family)
MFQILFILLKKGMMILVAVLLFGLVTKAQETGTLADSRDGKTYKTVKIGTQWWMSENLNFAASKSYCYKDITSYCDQYGRQYRIYEVIKDACPTGWHIPSDAEWMRLERAIGLTDQNELNKFDGPESRGGAYGDGFQAADKIKASGFNPVAGGINRDEIGAMGYYWTTSVDNDGKYIYRYIPFSTGNRMDLGIGRSGDMTSDYKMSIRCVKD